MLSPERAAELLKPMANDKWEQKRLVAVKLLPQDARKVAYAIMRRDEHGKALTAYNNGHWHQARLDKLHRAYSRARALLDALNDEDRRAIFDTLFGRLAPNVQQGYDLLYRLPYQTDYRRKAFRAPYSSRVTRSTRLSWLTDLLYTVGPYDQPITWFASWATYLGWHQDILGKLFAAVIDAGGVEGDEVFDILVSSAKGEHEVGAMGRHVSRALLVASRPDGWEFMERMLLAAQRQEGLRQVILETIDEAHPQAFRRMLRLIIENDLTRFPATVRAIDVWLDLAWESAGIRVVNDTLRELLEMLENPSVRSATLQAKDANPQTLYLALWALAFEDSMAAIEPASHLLSAASPEHRFVAAHLLKQLQLARAHRVLVPALDDPDLRVAISAFYAFVHSGIPLKEIGLFEAYERLIARLPPKQRNLEPIVWPWTRLIADRQIVAGELHTSLEARSPKRLIPYLPMMASWQRADTIRLLMEREQGDAEARDAIFSMVGDASSTVREKAIAAVPKFWVTPGDIARFEALLTRKPGDLRRGVISILLAQPDRVALESTRRLATSKDVQQRLAGLELLNQMVAAGRSEAECRAVGEEYKRARPTLGTDEEKLLEGLLPTDGGEVREKLTLENGLGLYHPATRTTPVPPPRPKEGLLNRLFKGSKQEALVSDAAVTVIRSLDDLVHAYREMPITVDNEYGAGKREELLGNMNWGFPMPTAGRPIGEEIANLPLRDELEKWWVAKPNSMRDDDGLEILRALAPFETGHWGIHGYRHMAPRDPKWVREAFETLYANFDTQKLRYGDIVHPLLMWVLKMHPPQGAPDFLLSAIAVTFSVVPQNEWRKEKTEDDAAGYNPWVESWRTNDRLMGWLDLARYHRNQFAEEWSGAHHIQLWKLLRWLDEPAEGVSRLRPGLDIVLAAYSAGGATEADVLDHIIGPRSEQQWGRSFNELYQLSGRKPAPEVGQYPFLRDVVERCRARILQVELGRGDMPTPASHAALSLRWAGGMDTLVQVLASMGRDSFLRGWNYDTVSKASVFSHLVRSTFPAEGDIGERFAAEMRAARITDKRLLELAMYAPQWARYVEYTLGWPKLEEGVWWVHAHTKDTAWTVDQEIRETWAAQVSERTPLSAQSLLDGAVDVTWFNTVYSTLGPEQWEKLYSVAPYASGGGGHKRAQLFADAMLGRVSKTEIVGRIKGKRHQDAVRALGLIPLPDGEGEREAEILDRYKTIQEFKRGSRAFGAQRQASEKLATSIALENLARTAGYPDPVRLEWAMEAKAIDDLVRGPLTARVGEVVVELAINDWGKAELQVSKKGKVIKNIPPSMKKDAAVAHLREREREVGRQASRMRLSLEGAMCRGDEFTSAELRDFFDHPVLKPMVERLIFVCEGTSPFMGYPVESGAGLRRYDGTMQPIAQDNYLRVAHPYDLLSGGEWHLWQHDLFVSERVQPFKQVFRELYVLTGAERSEADRSRRYEGHQVNPKQALALLGSRGWVNHPEEGIKRTFHDANISAWLAFQEGSYTPAEVDGLTVEYVYFSKRGEWRPMSMDDVPPRVFSEVMRDLDLVVSVAHRGGVDPEASASTVEMRAALLTETCNLLKLSNVRVQGQHALITGELGSYSVHLGSAVVHRQPGGALCIIPVHSQHRGRIFLPFADDDPKTAEVLSKVLLLARDKEIRDPTILEQILPARSYLPGVGSGVG